MATLKIDTSQATANVQQLNNVLEDTEKTVSDVNKEGGNLGDTFNNVGKAAENMSGGINAADKVLDALGKSAGNANSLAGQAIKSVIPQLKAGLKGATLSFRSLGKAIAATGVGLLVQGLALLIANFKTVTTWVKNFGKAAQTSMPGVAKVINNVANAFGNIRNRIREIVANFGNTAFGRWLGLDKAAEKFKAIKDAADQATAATKAQMEALEEVDTKTGGKGGTKQTRKTYDQVADVSSSNYANAVYGGASMVKGGKSAVAQRTEEQKMLNKAVADAIKQQKVQYEFDKKQHELWGKLTDEQRNYYANQVSGIGAIAGAMASMVEENSVAYKALMTLQIVANTAAGAMTAFTALDNPTMAQKWISYGAIITAGVAQLASLYSGKIDKSTTPSATAAVAPTLSAPTPSATLATAQMANAQGQQVYITERQLIDDRDNQVRLKQNTVF